MNAKDWARCVQRECSESDLVRGHSHLCMINDRLLVTETACAWLQATCFGHTVIASVLDGIGPGGDGLLYDLQSWADKSRIMATPHGEMEAFAPLSPRMAADFLTRDAPGQDLPAGRTIDPALAFLLLEQELNQLLRRFESVRRNGGGEPTEMRFLEVVCSDEFIETARDELRNALMEHATFEEELVQQLRYAATRSQSDVDLGKMWAAWSKIAPVMPPGSDWGRSDLGYSLLDALLDTGLRSALSAILALSEKDQLLIHRELDRMLWAIGLAWQLAPGSPATARIASQWDALTELSRKLSRLRESQVGSSVRDP